ncbi:MAG: CocE/NonD family hydrolase C-terminal non-catalytic domain-containing protein [Prochlorococcaceae cyanobacterium]
MPEQGGHLGLDAGPCDRSDLDQRADVACFSSAPIEQPLLLQGRPVLELNVGADQPSFDLCGALSLLEPSGQVQQLSTGVLRLPAASGQAPQSQTRRCRLVFQPLCHSLHAGQRLRLSLAAAAWPQVAVNGGSGELPQTGADPSHRVISLTLELDGSRMQLEPLVSAKLT